MTISRFTKCLIGSVLLLFVLCGFAGEPTLESVRTSVIAEKMKKVIFLYEEKNLELKESQPSYSSSFPLQNNRAYLSDTGFPGFGDLLVVQASETLTEAGLSVVHSGYAPEGRLKDYLKELPEFVGPDFDNSALVVISPASADTFGSGTVASVNVRLSVAVRNARTGQLIWGGLINTSTRIGKGFISSRLITPTLYDREYAVSILNLLANAWRRNGIR